MAYSLLSMTVLNKGGVSEIIRLYWSAETFKGCLQAHTASLAQTMYSETISNGVRTISNQPLIVFVHLGIKQTLSQYCIAHQDARVYLECDRAGHPLQLPCFSCSTHKNKLGSLKTLNRQIQLKVIRKPISDITGYLSIIIIHFQLKEWLLLENCNIHSFIFKTEAPEATCAHLLKRLKKWH